MRSLTIAILLLGCSTPQQPPPSAPSAPPPTVVEWEVHGPSPDDPGEPGSSMSNEGSNPGAVASKPQPPDTKLKLGHYRSAQHNIGLVIDRTSHVAKLRFDHVADTLRLDPQRSTGRTDYIRSINNVVLQVWDSGKVTVFVPGTHESIDVARDADADPL